jgi:predicted AlkP superfamily pyrophosphatase or phosphodiesterase
LRATEPKKLILVVIDGLTPSMLEETVERGHAPALSLLVEHGRYRRAVSTFPSLTPVCLSSLATGAHPDVHEIPHLVWYHRGERRLVEYGSSFGALRAAGAKRSIIDTIYGLNASHLGKRAVTVYEALEDAGLTAAAVNITCYRGRTEHRPTVPFLTRPALGPKRFFFYNLFESDVTGAPLAVRRRPRGTIDAYAAAVGRWLVTRDGFDFLVFYLSDYDYASHAQGPDAAHAALARCDEAVGTLIAAAGGPDEFLERYAVILCSDHGQTPVREVGRLQEAFPDAIVTASNRAGMVYTDAEPGPLAAAVDANPAVDVVLWREGDEAVARRQGEEVRFTPAGPAGDASILDDPAGFERAWAALANPNAGELIVSAAAGWEFADLAGRHHAGGGSHGSLLAGDSEVPMLTIGLDVVPGSIVEVMPAVLDHFGVALPPYARPLVRA